jgi:DNA-directed RNA polymerase subunit N (RpoN/RPB10)
MIIPVRCFSCGKVVGSLWEEYEKLLKEGKTKKEALDILNVKRYCCRSVLLSHINNIEIVGKYL